MQNNDKNTTTAQLKEIIQEFVIERDWQQFHSPKNIALKLSVEAGELLEKFAWIKEEDSFAAFDKNKQEIEHEVADVFILLLSFCNTTNIDLTSAMIEKLKEVTTKYPVEKAKGVYTKYNKL
ncbi:nucleotide pyrophosphohydrolase [Candidatus Babeliales bacterium]|nr:nucleotide pyrophosphohydrolase [Candidatus Babeliales bacterium]MBP9843310.1 nucleotide pyrophosphohydrolase [Candidatus Babeliales bacterium]